MFIASAAGFLLLAVLFYLAYPRTEYAFDFSEPKFQRIAAGMSETEVLVGWPLQTRKRITCRFGLPSPKDPWALPAREETWTYSVDKSGGPLDKGYRVRRVCLSNDVVVRVEKALVWQRWVWQGW